MFLDDLIPYLFACTFLYFTLDISIYCIFAKFINKGNKK